MMDELVQQLMIDHAYDNGVRSLLENITTALTRLSAQYTDSEDSDFEDIEKLDMVTSEIDEMVCKIY